MEPISTSALLISGGIQGGTSLIQGIMQYYATKETNAQNLKLANIARNDALEAQNYARGQDTLNRAESAEQRGYVRAMGNYERGAALLTTGMNLLQAKAAPFQKYAGGR